MIAKIIGCLQAVILTLISTFRGAITTGIDVVDEVVWFVFKVLFYLTVLTAMFYWGEVLLDHWWIVFNEYAPELLHSADAPANAAAVEQGAIILSPTDVPIVIPDGS